MTLRTPRRRISPQTRRRCRAIKGFFKRALGSLSQPDLLQITSSIAVNVTDINHKISGLEKQLHEVSRTCRPSIQEIDSEHSISPTPNHSRQTITQRETPSNKDFEEIETNIIYSKPDNQYKSSNQSDQTVIRINSKGRSNNIMNDNTNDEKLHKLKKKMSKTSNIHNYNNDQSTYSKFKTQSNNKHFASAYSTSSFHSLDQFRKMNYTIPGFSGNVEGKINQSKTQKTTNKIHRKVSPEGVAYTEKVDAAVKRRKSKHKDKEIDSDFIADIIRRQYKPVKFGRRNSDLSQFSVPVCRDREFCMPSNCCNIPGEYQLCNCETCYYNKCSRHSDFTAVRSVCDARLYNVRRSTRTKHRTRQVGAYDNADFYDLVPVKEKSSPKTRRKFFEDGMRSAYYKEVPPSPRTHRPQLNLKARYVESDYNVEFVRNSDKLVSPRLETRQYEKGEHYPRSVNRRNKTQRKACEEFEEKYDQAEIQTIRKNTNLNQVAGHHANGILNAIYPILTTEEPEVLVETSLNKTRETETSDKTDKALGEIKDILQSFLLEIKKEASTHNDKSNISARMTESGNNPLNNANTMTSAKHSFSNFSAPPCTVNPLPYMSALPPFGNSCCYPLLPMCPMNCMQNSYILPSTSFTHNNCVDKSNDTHNNENIPKSETIEACETDELIKEIYKFVSQSPTFCRKVDCSKESNSKAFRTDEKVVTSRSVGGSTQIRRHDAKVGTPKMRCVSKSCEAIKITDAYSSDTNASYSDTVLDKLSLEATNSTSETESITEVSEDKMKKSKFAKVLKSLGLTKKIKKDVIEELSESESATVEEEKKKSPFHQNIAHYAMHSQEYYRPPPVSPNFRPEYRQDYRPPCNNDIPYWDPRLQHSRCHGSPRPLFHNGGCPTAPPYSQSYESYPPMQPQVPLFLKEVEVKSIGCQSERKFSLFRKITQKKPQPTGSLQDAIQKNGSTQTAKEKTQTKPTMFNWKNPEVKQYVDPYTFGYQTQKKLALGDVKMRNAMFKKMFHKRNPFSPRNLIIRTIMGRDKSSFGEPQGSLRTRLFM